jgi:phosphopantothenoylcysteine decarboxylase / phosphopantothenate---cysteine ligase
MNILITAGPTHESIDAVRYIANRSSGKLGAALAEAALRAGHAVTLIAGPVAVPMPLAARRIDVETARQMHDTVLRELPGHDLLIMAAAVADFRPAAALPEKLPRGERLRLELEPTEDILAAAAAARRPGQRLVGFSLVQADDLPRSRAKLASKGVDLLVHNPLQTMGSDQIAATLLYSSGRQEALPPLAKADFAAELLSRCAALFDDKR